MNTLRNARINNNLTQKQLAENAGVFWITISKIETGYSKPHKSTKIKLENVLGESIDWTETREQGAMKHTHKRRKLITNK